MLSLALIFLAAFAGAFAADCVPEQTQLYWAPTCKGQTFENRIDATDIQVTQSGQSVDSRGGLDLKLPIDVAAKINNKYGVIAKPLGALGIFEYAKPLIGGACEWKAMPTFGMLDSIDSCTMVENCHLYNETTTLKATIDVNALAGPLLHLVKLNSYYGLTLTFRDDKTEVCCVYIQAKVIGN